MALMAAQTQGSIEYAKAPAGTAITFSNSSTDVDDTDGVVTYDELNKLNDITLDSSNLTVLEYTDGKVSKMTYVSSGYTATYDGTTLAADKT